MNKLVSNPSLFIFDVEKNFFEKTTENIEEQDPIALNARCNWKHQCKSIIIIVWYKQGNKTSNIKN